MVLLSIIFAYCSWRTNDKGDKRNGTVEDWDGAGREGKGKGGKGWTVTCIKLLLYTDCITLISL